MKIGSAVIFDLDGTLLDSLHDLADSMNTVLAARGFPAHPVTEYRYFVGDGIETLALRVLPSEVRHQKNIVLSLIDMMRDEYARNWNRKTRPYDGITELLDALELRKIPMAILSNKPDPFTQKIVSKLLGRWSFKQVIGAQAGLPKKPDPTGAIRIAEHLDTAPEHCFYLGDTSTDMKTAVSAGMYPIGVLWGFRTAEELTRNGARKLISYPGDLLSIIDQKSKE